MCDQEGARAPFQVQPVAPRAGEHDERPDSGPRPAPARGRGDARIIGVGFWSVRSGRRPPSRRSSAPPAAELPHASKTPRGAHRPPARRPPAASASDLAYGCQTRW